MKRANLVAERRPKKGKNAARQLRREKKIPAILYGRGTEPVPLAVGYQDFTSALHGEESRNTLFNLRITNGEEQEILSLPKEIQFHPVDGTVMHVDFQQIHVDETIHTQVPIHLVGSPPGVKEGGILEHLLRELDVECLPLEIPDRIEVDVSALGIGDSLHVSDLKPVASIRVLSDAQRTVALVAAPTVEKAPVVEVAEEAPVEGEEKAEGEKKESPGESEKVEASSKKQSRD